jgi:hypothetical protein
MAKPICLKDFTNGIERRGGPNRLGMRTISIFESGMASTIPTKNEETKESGTDRSEGMRRKARMVPLPTQNAPAVSYLLDNLRSFSYEDLRFLIA